MSADESRPDAANTEAPNELSTGSGSDSTGGAARDFSTTQGVLGVLTTEPHLLGSYNAIIQALTRAYCNGLDPDDPPTMGAVEQQLVALMGIAFDVVNEQREAKKRLVAPRKLEPMQAAMVVDRLHTVREVVPGGTDADDGLGLLTVYQCEGEFEGVSRRADLGLLEGLARQLNVTSDERWYREFERALRQMIERVPENENRDLIPMRNYIYNYSTGEYLPYSREFVTLAKSATNLPESAPPEPEIENEDGTIWRPSEFMEEVLPDEGSRLLVYQVIGMCLRAFVVWRKAVNFIGSGLNGKGTVIELIRQIVGLYLAAAIPPGNFDKPYALSGAIGKRVNLVDEVNVGEFIEKAGNFKNVLSHDPIEIDRKYRDPISIVLRMVVVASVNEWPKYKDKTQAMLDRQVLVEFPRRFDGADRNDAIKDDYVKRPEVREWFAYKVLVEMPEYYRLSEPESVVAAMRQFRAETDFVVGYWEEFEDQFHRDFLPFEMLYEHYKALFKGANPSGSPEQMHKVTKKLKEIVDPDEWVVPKGANGKDLEFSLAQWFVGAEPVLEQFDYLPAVNNWNWDAPSFRGNAELTAWAKKKRKARGFVRRSVYEAHIAAGTTPYKARHP